MKKFIVSDIRWASENELNLPIWKNWNKNNPLPRSFWQRIWEYPYLTSKIPSSGNCVDFGGTYPFVLFKNYPNAISVDNRDLNVLDFPFHKGKWTSDKLTICDAAKTPFNDNQFEYSFSISTIEEIPHFLDVLKEMVRIAKHRVVITMDVSDKLGLPIKRLRELEEFLGCKIPDLPINVLRSNSPLIKKFGQDLKEDYKHIRVLAFTLDSIDLPKSVAILIPHWESYQFLKPCLERIQKNRNPNLAEKVYVLDDYSNDGSFEKAKEDFKNDKLIEFHKIERYNKKTEPDVGLLLDEGLKLVKEQFVVMLDADTFPLSNEWINFPIWLIEKYSASSIGLDTGLSSAYYNDVLDLPIWQPSTGYVPSANLYYNEWFTCTNNLYRITRTAVAKVVSEQIGFTRATKEKKSINRYFKAIHTRLMRRKGFIKRLYKSFLKFNFLKKLINARYPYLPGGCDNGVAANHFIDINYMGAKFNLPITSFIGFTPKDGVFGQNISGLLFHFALSTRALSKERREIKDAGAEFMKWVELLSQKNVYDDKIIDDMIDASKTFKPGGYDGSIPVEWYKDEFDYIQKLLDQYKKELK